jgi:para-nitrobenzyl esterase
MLFRAIRKEEWPESTLVGDMCTRSLLAAAALLVLPSAFLHAQPAGNLLVKAPAGSLQGSMQTTQGGPARAFLGIPYAAPPVGDLRWKPDAPAPTWTGVRQATTFGSRCMQPALFDDMFFRDPGPSEDCLTLNIWTPANASPSARLPVMFWIYGGGFNTGGSSEPRQDGAHLATKGVIVVSFNYRLGIFGFYTHPELAAESPTHSAGNYGLMDAVAALRWVRANISSFDGDPNNVTIFGESAGSFAVSGLMASPTAHGLFEHAIGESGGALGGPTLRFDPVATREAKDADFARDKLHADTLAALRALPAEQLLAAAGPAHFSPDIDGSFLTESPAAIFAEGKQNDVPMIAGWNHDEGGSGKAATTITPTGGSSAAPSANALSDTARLREMAEKDFGDRASQFLTAFPGGNDAEALASIQEYSTAKFIAFGTWKWLEAQTATGKAPAYRYRFDLVPPPDPARPNRFGAFHSDDIEYVFGNLDSRKGIAWRPEDYAMSEQMMTYWSSFARTGDPNRGVKGTNLPLWPVYAPASGSKVMYLNQPSTSEKDPLRDQFLFLQSAWK